jgi:hypothetical protein
MTRAVYLFERFITQKTVYDHDSGKLEGDGFVTRRLEYESGLITKSATQKGVYETLNILARIGDVPYRIECVWRLFPVVRFDGTRVRALVREQS